MAFDIYLNKVTISLSSNKEVLPKHKAFRIGIAEMHRGKDDSMLSYEDEVVEI